MAARIDKYYAPILQKAQSFNFVRNSKNGIGTAQLLTSSNILVYILEMANLGPARGPKRADTGLMIFYLRFLCSLCAGRLVVTRELCVVVTCKCVVY